MKWIGSAVFSWKLAYEKPGLFGLKDTFPMKSARRLNRELTAQEQTAKLEAKIKLLEAENELLKKVYLMERGEAKVVKSLTPSQKYELITQVIEHFNLKSVIGYFCDTLNVSRSGYYRYFSGDAK